MGLLRPGNNHLVKSLLNAVPQQSVSSEDRAKPRGLQPPCEQSWAGAVTRGRNTQCHRRDTELPHAGRTATNTKSRRHPQTPPALKARQGCWKEACRNRCIPTSERLLTREANSQTSTTCKVQKGGRYNQTSKVFQLISLALSDSRHRPRGDRRAVSDSRSTHHGV